MAAVTAAAPSRRNQQAFDAIRRAYPHGCYREAQEKYVAERKRRKQLAELLRAASAASAASAAAAAETAAAAAVSVEQRPHHPLPQQREARSLVTKARRPSELFLIGSEVETLKTHTYIGHGQSVNQMLMQYNGVSPAAAGDTPCQQQIKGRGTWFPCLTIVIPAHKQAQFNKQWRIECTSAWRKDARNIDRRTTWGLRNVVLKYSTADAPFVWFIATRLVDPVQYPTLFSLLCTDFYDADQFAPFLFARTSARSVADLTQTIRSDMRVQARARFPIQYFYGLLDTQALQPQRLGVLRGDDDRGSDGDSDSDDDRDGDRCRDYDDDDNDTAACGGGVYVYERDALLDTTSFERSYRDVRKALRG